MTKIDSDKNCSLYLTLVKDTLTSHCAKADMPLGTSKPSDFSLPHCTAKTVCASWLESGQIAANKKTLQPGHGLYLGRSCDITLLGREPVVMFRFIVSGAPLDQIDNAQLNADQSSIIDTQLIRIDSADCQFRLDQVDFPPGAVAYKHTHSGAGIRYLVYGGLTLSTDHGEQSIRPGDAWFEGANSPVIATATQTEPSRFIRAMLLPSEFEGRSTFTLQDSRDADKPRLQTNIRHSENRIVLTDFH